MGGKATGLDGIALEILKISGTNIKPRKLSISLMDE